jgi:hypothetical protein
MSLLSTDALPGDPLDAIEEITASEVELDRLRCALVKKARQSGRSWEQIASALGTSRQAAWEYYTARFRAELEQVTGANGDLSEDEATELAVAESRAVRRRRRS